MAPKPEILNFNMAENHFFRIDSLTSSLTVRVREGDHRRQFIEENKSRYPGILQVGCGNSYKYVRSRMPKSEIWDQ